MSNSISVSAVVRLCPMCERVCALPLCTVSVHYGTAMEKIAHDTASRFFNAPQMMPSGAQERAHHGLNGTQETSVDVHAGNHQARIEQARRDAFQKFHEEQQVKLLKVYEKRKARMMARGRQANQTNATTITTTLRHRLPRYHSVSLRNVPNRSLS